MNSVNIFEKNWLDLVFEGKNKSYGAYQLRQESSKTTLLAFFCGMLLLSGLALIPLLATTKTAAMPVTIPSIDKIVKLATYEPNIPEPKTAVIPLVKKPITDVEKKEQLVNPEVVKKEDANQNIATNHDNQTAPETPENNNSGSGITAINGTTSGSGTIATTTPSKGNGETINITSTLDELPEFPGGINKFYQYVGNNFEKPELDISEAKVFVSFVIEKDGKMTDIKVLRNPGYGLDKEAIRVLRSLRTKWKPGIKDGEAVRTLYTLPITVKL